MRSEKAVLGEGKRGRFGRLSSLRRLYFIGIGGSGMYGCARLAQDRGFCVRGSDARESANLARLRLAGIPVAVGTPPLPMETDAVVYSLAVMREHPQMKEAEERGIPCIDRAELLGALSEGYLTAIAVAGSHGKSSTVGMCAEILREAGLSPTVLVGADLSEKEGGYRKGSGSILLAEACEYKDSFLSLSATHALVLNAEWEHTDYFPDEQSVLRSFYRFLHGERVAFRIASSQTALPADLVFGNERGIHLRGLCIEKGCPRFSVFLGQRQLCEISLRVIGAHQAQNALAAFSLGYALGVPTATIRTALNAYRGVGGRMQYVKTVKGAPLYLDYAHHPTELAAALESAKTLGKRLICVFEPHTYSRVAAFEGELSHLLSLPDKAGVLPIYAAREKNTYGVSAQRLAEKAGAAFLPSFASAAEFLTENAEEGSVLLLAGAGLAREVLAFMG